VAISIADCCWRIFSANAWVAPQHKTSKGLTPSGGAWSFCGVLRTTVVDGRRFNGSATAIHMAEAHDWKDFKSGETISNGIS
jgi:hypothetical protein